MKTTFKNFIISSEFIKEESAPLNNYNKYKITIKNINDNKEVSFDFLQSIIHPIIKETKELINSFYCFLSDAVYGSYSFSSFCDEFGYCYEEIFDARIEYNSCKNQYNKALYLIGNKESVISLFEEITSNFDKLYK